MRLLKITFAVLLLTAPAVSALAQDPVQIDVMIVYTQAAREYAGGEDAMQADVLAAVGGANAVFENSGINVELNLVFQAEVDYVESDSFETDLNRLRDPKDGYMEEVHRWRDDWGADLVALFRRGSVDSVAGRANLLVDEFGRPDQAFSVTSDAAALASHTFVHEIGHNMGAAHAHEDDDSEGVFSFSHGHRFDGDDGNHYRTVMASPTSSPSRTRVPHISNPDVRFAEVATGVPEGEPNAADNARTLDFTAPVVADYRSHQPEEPDIVRTSPVHFGVVPGSRAFLSVEAVGVPTMEFQWYEGASGNTDAPIAGATEASFETSEMKENSSFWVRVSNDNGVVDSAAMSIFVEDSPPDPGLDQEQSSLSTAAQIFAWGGLWQEFVPDLPYLDAVTLPIVREGNPGDLVLLITDASGMPVVKRRLDSTSVPQSFTWAEIPVGVFLTEHETYRMILSSAEPHDSDNSYSWVGDEENPYSAGSSSIEPFLSGFDFGFQTYAAAAVVGTPPAFTGHPEDVVIDAGELAAFTVSVSGDPEPTLQWERSTDGGDTWETMQEEDLFSGVDTDTLQVSDTTVDLDGDRFRSVADNGVGDPVASAAALLSVHARILMLSGDLDFGEVTIGESATRALTLENTGNATLAVTGLAFPEAYSGEWSGGTIAAGESRVVTVTFEPPSAQEFTGTVSVDSDATGGDEGIAISGVGFEAPFVSIAPESLAVPAAAATHAVTVASNTSWVVENIPDWANVEPASGSGDAELSVSVDENASVSTRSAVIAIGGRELALDQEGMTADYALNPESLMVEAPGGEVSTELSASPPDAPWTVSGLPEWIALSGPQSGTGSATIVLDVSENEETTPRSAHLQVADAALSVSQEGVALSAPAFTGHPEDVVIDAGEPATFTVSVSGDPEPTLQWERSTDGGDTWKTMQEEDLFSGVDTDTLQVSDTTVDLDGDRFRSVADNGVGDPVASEAALLSVDARILVLSGDLDFGEVTVGESATRALTLENAGNAVLTVSGLTFPEAFSGDWSGGTIAARDSRVMAVTFEPPSAQKFAGTVSVESDATAGDEDIAVGGVGFEAPFVSIYEDSDSTLDLGHGWKWNALGYWYDGFFPYVYSFGIGDWLFVIGESEDAYYFWAMTRIFWCFTGADYYPHYLILTGDDAGSWAEVGAE